MTDELRKIVNEATPGPWGSWHHEAEDPEYSNAAVYGPMEDTGAWPVIAEGLIAKEDATYLATFDPVMVGLLLDVAEFMRDHRDTIGCANTYDDLGALLDRLEEVRRD